VVILREIRVDSVSIVASSSVLLGVCGMSSALGFCSGSSFWVVVSSMCSSLVPLLRRVIIMFLVLVGVCPLMICIGGYSSSMSIIFLMSIPLSRSSSSWSSGIVLWLIVSSVVFLRVMMLHSLGWIRVISCSTSMLCVVITACRGVFVSHLRVVSSRPGWAATSMSSHSMIFGFRCSMAR